MSAWSSPERAAFDDAKMELNIAAERWHAIPDDVLIQDELHRAVVVFIRARDAWVKRVSEGAADERGGS